MKKTYKTCSSFKPLSEFISPYNKALTPTCSHCVYYSSRNCHRDVADSIDTELDIF